MSSTNRGASRINLDSYYTPDHVARACVQALRPGQLSTAWEPHAGGGAFVRALQDTTHVSYVVASDLSPAAGVQVHDARDGWKPELAPHWDGDCPDYIVGNPPFDEAQDHIEMALKTAQAGVGFILRIGFLEGTERYKKFWRWHPATELHTFVRRPSFLERWEDGSVGYLRKRDDNGEIVLDRKGVPKKAGTDSAAYAFYVWRKFHSGPTTQHFLTWEDPA